MNNHKEDSCSNKWLRSWIWRNRISWGKNGEELKTLWRGLQNVRPPKRGSCRLCRLYLKNTIHQEYRLWQIVFQQQMSRSNSYYGDLCELQVDAIVNAKIVRCWDVLSKSSLADNAIHTFQNWTSKLLPSFNGEARKKEPVGNAKSRQHLTCTSTSTSFIMVGAPSCPGKK